MKIDLKTTALTIVGLLLVSAGCQDTLTTDTAANVPNARSKETTISANCIVTFYLGEAAGYISEQKHLLRPALGDIDITALEPEGTFRRQLAGGVYKSSGPDATAGQSPVAVIDRDITLAIITAFKVSAGLYTADSGEKLDQIKIDGKWYLPIKLPNTAATGAGITLFQARDDGAIDLMWVYTADKSLTTARPYNMQWLNDAEASVPTKIDIFRRTDGATEDTKILEVHYTGFSIP